MAPRASDEVDSVLTEAGSSFERFSASHTASSPGAARIVGRAWDLPAIGQSYDEFVTTLRPVMKAITVRSTEEEAYVARFRLVHAWRSFLFHDPQLPAALLPAQWPGIRAAGFFDKHASRLRPAADRYVERCLQSAYRRGRVGSEP